MDNTHGLGSRRSPPTSCCAVILLMACTAAVFAQSADGAYWPGGTWRKSAPEDQGLDSKVLNKIDEHVKKDFPAMTSVLVVRNGTIVFEKYYRGGQDDLRSAYSITKALVGALTGIAVEQGLVDGPDAEIYRYLPEPIRIEMEGGARKITVRQLLTHTSGLRDNMGNGDIDQAALSATFRAGLAHAPGEVFAYNGNNANLLSVIVSQASGLRASEFARKFLFDRIGVKQARWEEGWQWTSGYTGVVLTTRDMARFGYLYLRKGRWNNEQVIPADWVAESMREQVPIPQHYRTPGIDDAYGYQLWTMWYDKHAACSMIGANGQRICVIPDLDLVIVFTGTGGGFDVEHLPIIRECILASVVK